MRTNLIFFSVPKRTHPPSHPPAHTRTHTRARANTHTQAKFAEVGESGYKFRREPSFACVSSLEAVAYSIRFLERAPQGFHAEGVLLRAFEGLVQTTLRRKHLSTQVLAC
jgi:hypothetical protein